MTEELLINITPRETRVAMVESAVVQELWVERASRRGLVGNIYCGKVARVLPGMQAAFVEIGLERAAFLHVSDMLQAHPLEETAPPESFALPEIPSITELLKPGQLLVVQVIKDPIGSKGARLTTHLSLPSRYLVFVPDMQHVGISVRIEDINERERLKELVGEISKEGGYIVRTAAEGATSTEIAQDKTYLTRLWEALKPRIARPQFAEVIHEDLPLYLRTLRDLVHGKTEKIRIDSEKHFHKAMGFAKEFIPELLTKIELYDRPKPIFDLYNIDEEIQKALSRKVALKSGGHVVFDQTEAMTTIDINTGAFVGHRNLEETIFKTNLEATHVIARQLRLRNVGGIIIVDFIDMEREEHKEQVLRALERDLVRDNTKYTLGDLSPLGLVEMTRKRTRESLLKTLCEPCPVCLGKGAVKSIETVCNEIFREILRNARAYETKSFLVIAATEVVERMLDEEATSVAELVEGIGKSIQFQAEALYAQENFDVVLM